MNKLEELLGKELYEAFVAKVGNTKVIIDDGSFIPKHRLDEVIAKNSNLTKQLESYETDLNVLRDKAKGNEELTATIAKLQTEKEQAKTEAEKQMTLTRKGFALKEALLNAGVVSDKARNLLSKEFDIEKLELEESGTVKGFDALLKPIKEDKTFSSMFGVAKISGQPHNQGHNESDFFTRDEIVAMTADQLNDPATLAKVNKSLEQIK